MPRQRSTTTDRSVRRIRRRPAFEPLEPRCLLAALAMTDDEQLVIEMINRARANPAAEAARLGIALNQGLPPATLTDTPKQPLAPHQLLIDTAAAHSQDMVDREFFDHVNPDGEDPGERLAEAGYPTRSWGENIALNEDASRAHDSLFRSPGHRLNLLRDSFREVGVGIAVRADHSINMTELLASRSGNVFLTGVAFSDRSDGNNFFSPGEGLDAVTITATGRNRGTVYTTITGPTGGYSLQVPTDTYDLTASNGELTDPIQVRDVAVGAQNVKVDFVVPYVALEPDSLEPNNSLGQATVLAAEARTLQHLSIHQTGDQDYFRLQAPANGPLIVELDSHRDAGDLDLDLYDSKGGLIAEAKTLDPIERIEHEVTKDTVYYLRVAPYQGAVHPDYDLTVVPPPVPAAPVANDDRAMTLKDMPVVIDVLANDSGDFPLDVTSVTIVSQPLDGKVTVDPGTGKIEYTPGPAVIGPDEFTYQVRDSDGAWSSGARVLVAVVDVNERPWHNPREPRDVNADHAINASDVLILVNDLNTNQARTLPVPTPQGTFPPPYLDVTGDGAVSPGDVLEIVNFINNRAVGEGEAPLAAIPRAVEDVADSFNRDPTGSADAEEGSADASRAPRWVAVKQPRREGLAMSDSAILNRPRFTVDLPTDLPWSGDLLAAIEAIAGQ